MNSVRTTFLMTFLTVNLVAAGRALDGEAGALIAFTFSSAMHGISYWFGDKIVLRVRGARGIRPDEAPRLYRIVQEVTHQAQVPMPNLYLLPQKNPTVFATGRDPKHAAVAVTVDILNLDDAKIRSVLGRELSRIKNGDKLIGTIAASAAGAVSVLANIGK
jgi:heat shock protein HtpX